MIEALPKPPWEEADQVERSPEPAYLVSPEDAGASATFAIRVAGLALVPESQVGDPARVERWHADQLAWHRRLVGSLLSDDPDRTIELRYLATRAGLRSRIDLTLVARRSADTAAAAVSCARCLWVELEGLFGTNSACAVVPVGEQSALESLLAPFTPTSAVEVRRPVHALWRDPSRHRVGFVRDEWQQGELSPITLTFGMGEQPPFSTLAGMCGLLGRASGRVMVAVRLGPALPRGRALASSTVKQLETGLNNWRVRSDSLTRRLSTEDAAMHARLRDLRDRRLHELRVVIASDGDVSPALARAVAADLLPAPGGCWQLVPIPPDAAATIFGPRGVRLADVVESDILAVAATDREAERAAALPLSGQPVPGVRTFKSNMIHVPAEVAREGCLVGLKKAGEVRVPVRIPFVGGARHTYVIGSSGCGKSTALASMILSDVGEGAGVGVIDPHGDLIDTLLGRIPAHRVDDVVLIDPADRDWPVGLNLLECAGDDERDFVCGEFMLMIRKLWDPRLQEPMAFGPIFAQAMHAAVRTAMAFPEGGTVVDIPRLFEDERYRDRRLEQIDDPSLRAFWKVTWKQSDRGDVRPYITSKVDMLRQNHVLRRIVGQPRSTVNIRELMDGGKIILLNLSLGRLGAADAGLLGSVLVTRIFAAAMARAALPPERRRLFALYIDEFQAFSTDTIGSLISAARKYAVSVTLSHQNLSQVTPAIRDEVLGNVGNILCFRPGPVDVDYLQRYFHPTFSATELLALPNWVAAARLVGPRGVLTPFTFETIAFSEPPDPAMAATIQEQSRIRFARPRRDVDAELHARMTSDDLPKAADTDT